MNRKVSAWLPPDGDARLARFQETLVSWCGFPSAAVPAYLELSAGAPVGAVVAGGWRLHDGEPVWEARDDRGPAGVFRFGLGLRSWGPDDLAGLPTAPHWRWTKGVTAELCWEQPLGDASFILWTWGSRRGWRAAPPTR